MHTHGARRAGQAPAGVLYLPRGANFHSGYPGPVPGGGHCAQRLLPEPGTRRPHTPQAGRAHDHTDVVAGLADAGGQH